MKRSLKDDMIEEKTMKRTMGEEDEGGEMKEMRTGFSQLDKDKLLEVLKHVDVRTLGLVARISKLWWKTTKDERLWEMLYT